MGEEELLRARAVSAVRAAVLSRHEDAEVHELAAAGLPVGELADVLAPSLFGGHRLVVVSGVQEAAAALTDALISYAKDPDPELTLVVVHFGGKRNEALVKAFTAAGAALDECPKLTSVGDRIAFVRNEVRSAGGRITADAVTALVDAIGADLRQLSAAAGQLVSDFGGSIDGDAVARFHQGQAEVTGFTVAERVLLGDREGSIEMLRWALERGVAHVLIADAIADGVRTAARVASLNTTNIGELARVLKMPPWKIKKAQTQSRGWSIDGLQQAIGVAAELNADVKGAAASADYAARTRRPPDRDDPRRDGPRRPRPHRSLSAAEPARERERAPSRGGRGSFGAASGTRAQPQRLATCLAMPDLRLAAWFLWMTPLLAALSRALPAAWRAAVAAAASPESAAARKRRTVVLRADLTATLR